MALKDSTWSILITLQKLPDCSNFRIEKASYHISFWIIKEGGERGERPISKEKNDGGGQDLQSIINHGSSWIVQELPLEDLIEEIREIMIDASLDKVSVLGMLLLFPCVGNDGFPP